MVTAKELTRYRKKHGVSREYIAVEVGVSAQTVWRWEKGERIPGPAAKLLEQIISNGAQNGSSAPEAKA